MRKRPTKVYLTEEQLKMLDRACQAVGEERSRYIGSVLLNHLKDLNLIREAVHSGKNVSNRP